MIMENLGTARAQFRSADYCHGAIQPRYLGDGLRETTYATASVVQSCRMMVACGSAFRKFCKILAISAFALLISL